MMHSRLTRIYNNLLISVVEIISNLIVGIFFYNFEFQLLPRASLFPSIVHIIINFIPNVQNILSSRNRTACWCSNRTHSVNHFSCQKVHNKQNRWNTWYESLIVQSILCKDVVFPWTNSSLRDRILTKVKSSFTEKVRDLDPRGLPKVRPRLFRFGSNDTLEASLFEKVAFLRAKTSRLLGRNLKLLTWVVVTLSNNAVKWIKQY